MAEASDMGALRTEPGMPGPDGIVTNLAASGDPVMTLRESYARSCAHGNGIF